MYVTLSPPPHAWSDGLQQQRHKLADRAVATEQGFWCVCVLRRPSEFTYGGHSMLDLLTGELPEDLATQVVLCSGLAESSTTRQTDVAQQEGSHVQISDGA